ncbi:MAG: hypothetical protein FJW26_09505 [Acidimicrobiia bacterium]|nr:hypothetical protein [Acidimicrobiia bacterium]
MSTLARTLLFIIPVLICGAFSELSVGEQATKAPTQACALLSVAEIRKITGRDNYPEHVDGDPLGEGAGDGSSCQYGGESFMPGDHPPMLSLVLISGKGWTEKSRSFKLREGCKRDSVAGVGDDAFFESYPNPKLKRSAPLYVKVGTNDLIVQLDIKPPATEASARTTVIAVAKAAVAKLR